MWREAAEKMPATMCLQSPFDRATTEKLFLPSKDVTVTAKGVSHLYLNFRSKHLDQFLINSGKQSRKIQIRFDPRTIMEVYHHDPITSTFVAIPLDEPDLDLKQMSWKEFERDIKPTLKPVVLDPDLMKRGRIANRELIRELQQTRKSSKKQRREAETRAQFLAEQAALPRPANDYGSASESDDAWFEIDVVANIEDFR